MHAMLWAQDYALENRAHRIDAVLAVLAEVRQSPSEVTGGRTAGSDEGQRVSSPWRTGNRSGAATTTHRF